MQLSYTTQQKNQHNFYFIFLSQWFWVSPSWDSNFKCSFKGAHMSNHTTEANEIFTDSSKQEVKVLHLRFYFYSIWFPIAEHWNFFSFKYASEWIAVTYDNVFHGGVTSKLIIIIVQTQNYSWNLYWICFIG